MKTIMNLSPIFHKYWYITLLLCTICLQLGCKKIESLIIPTPIPMANWIKMWLEDPVCLPPCWNNIIPGTTNIYDAQKLIEQEPSSYKITKPANHLDPNNPISFSELSWTFLEDLSGGSAYSAKNSYVVSVIYLGFHSHLTIQDIIAKYGGFEKILIYDCRALTFSWACNVDLIYDKYGMAVGYLTSSYGEDHHRVKVLPDTIVWQVILYSNQEGYEKVFTRKDFIPLQYYEWHGYGEYP